MSIPDKPATADNKIAAAADKIADAADKLGIAADKLAHAGDKPGAPHSDALVFFGATGDLTYKKIFPALYAMERRGHLKVPVIGVARSDWTIEKFRARVHAPRGTRRCCPSAALSCHSAQRIREGDRSAGPVRLRPWRAGYFGEAVWP